MKLQASAWTSVEPVSFMPGTVSSTFLRLVGRQAGRGRNKFAEVLRHWRFALAGATRDNGLESQLCGTFPKI